MTKVEKETLRKAAGIIQRELLAGRSVRIQHFGALYLSKIDVFEGIHPTYTSDDYNFFSLDKLRARYVTRFRAFGALKERLLAKAMADAGTQRWGHL